MFRVYFSLILFTLLFLFSGCYFSWEGSLARLSLEILRSSEVEMAPGARVSEESFETVVFWKGKLNWRKVSGSGETGDPLISGYINSNPDQETKSKEPESETGLKSLLEDGKEARATGEHEEGTLDPGPGDSSRTGKFSSTFGFPLNLNPKGFRLEMRLKRGALSRKIRIIFMGRNLRNLLNFVVEGCRVHLFSKDEQNNSYLYDSSPLFLPKNSSEDLNLVMDWSQQTFLLSAVRPDNSLVALGSIVKTDSPLITSGSAFVGEELVPLQIEWSFTNRPVDTSFDCLISHFEERCKSNSVRMSGVSDLGFLGLSSDRGFLKVAFQFPPRERLPVSIRMMQGGELGATISFSLDQMVIHAEGNSFKHFFQEVYQEGEWLNLDLIPISNLSLDYLTRVLRHACPRRILDLKGGSSCLETVRKDASLFLRESRSHPTKDSCEGEFLQNLERSGMVLTRAYKVLDKQETEAPAWTGGADSAAGFRMLMAIDDEIIGKLEELVAVNLRIYLEPLRKCDSEKQRIPEWI